MQNEQPADGRLITQGWKIPTASYCDQPYVIQTDDGAWLCSLTTGSGREGAQGQHVATLRSLDHGRTWSAPLPVERPGSPENSYSVMLKLPSGRIYIFYNYNTENLREVRCHDGITTLKRVDSLGDYVFKYSDDQGRSWSARRQAIPVRAFRCDRDNVYGGAVRFFWNVGRPFIWQQAVYVPLTKVGQMGAWGFFQQSEGALLRSANLLTETDPEKICWETLPEGDEGLRAPPGGGPIAEEHSHCVLSDGSFYCVYRTVDGYPVESYSRDGGRTWLPPQYACFADGRRIKQPRAATFAWRCANGKYLLWFHNHGGSAIRSLWGRVSDTNGLVKGGGSPYDDRNPVWLCGGVECATPAGPEIRWSQPDIALYSDDPYHRMSYPDLIEDGHRLFLTETQKTIARVHEVSPELTAGLWRQLEGAAAPASPDTVLLDWAAPTPNVPAEIPAPDLPLLVERDFSRQDHGTRSRRAGFTLELWLDLAGTAAGSAFVDSRTPAGQGWALDPAGDGAATVVLNDGRTENRWTCSAGLLSPGRLHHLAVIVDGGPNLILFVINGALDDGGAQRQFGWGRFSPLLRHANGGQTLRVAPAVRRLRLHHRALRVADVIASGRAAGREISRA